MNKLVISENKELGTLQLEDTRRVLEENTINFFTSEKEVLKLCYNGDIFVNGRLAENDIQVVEGLREFLRGQGLYK